MHEVEKKYASRTQWLQRPAPADPIRMLPGRVAAYNASAGTHSESYQPNLHTHRLSCLTPSFMVRTLHKETRKNITLHKTNMKSTTFKVEDRILLAQGAKKK